MNFLTVIQLNQIVLQMEFKFYLTTTAEYGANRSFLQIKTIYHGLGIIQNLLASKYICKRFRIQIFGVPTVPMEDIRLSPLEIKDTKIREFSILGTKICCHCLINDILNRRNRFSNFRKV